MPATGRWTKPLSRSSAARKGVPGAISSAVTARGALSEDWVFNTTSGSTHMTDTPISPLRRRMIEDMTVRKFAARTQDGYIRAVKGFSTFLGASPATASAEDLRRYRLHLVESGVGAPTINHSLTALRFLFLVTLRKPAIVLDMPFVREPRRLPAVLSPQEVARLLDAAAGLKYKAALSIAYGAGLRGSEVVSRKIADIDSDRMVLRGEH